MRVPLPILAPMRTGLRIVALAVVVVTLTLWFFGGMNPGWTKTSVQMTGYDEVTEQNYPVWEKRFLPGVDFLGAGLLVGAGLFGSSFLIRKK